MSDMKDAPLSETASLPPDLVFLKRLVTILTVTMILGLIIVIGLLVTRLSQMKQVAAPLLPADIQLPAGTSARAVTMGPGWIAVVTDGNEILILDGTTGALRQRVAITPAP